MLPAPPTQLVLWLMATSPVSVTLDTQGMGWPPARDVSVSDGDGDGGGGRPGGEECHWVGGCV